MKEVEMTDAEKRAVYDIASAKAIRKSKAAKLS
ncbi:hypothetical protein BH18THE2_BH18THE2_09160 [soil metagenome]